MLIETVTNGSINVPTVPSVQAVRVRGHAGRIAHATAGEFALAWRESATVWVRMTTRGVAQRPADALGMAAHLHATRWIDEQDVTVPPGGPAPACGAPSAFR